MTETDKANILAAYERTALLGTIPEAKRIAVTAQALGISEELVKEALGVEA